MSWRLEGWKNPHKLTDNVYDPEAQMIVRDIHDAYEAGADAMLEVLRELITKISKEYHIDCDLFFYGGPENCEYECLPGLLKILNGASCECEDDPEEQP